jgi:hypothetical protein
VNRQADNAVFSASSRLWNARSMLSQLQTGFPKFLFLRGTSAIRARDFWELWSRAVRGGAEDFCKTHVVLVGKNAEKITVFMPGNIF